MDNAERHLGSDPEDIEDVLKTIEESYAIEFRENELAHVRTFGELTDHILAKIELQHNDDCTDQQAFYKLRAVIADIGDQDADRISPTTKLSDLFPWRGRIRRIRKIEARLGVSLNALRPHHLVTNALLLILIASVAFLFVDYMYTLAGLMFSIMGFWLAAKTGKEFSYETLGEMADRMTQMNYVRSRREYGTMNRRELPGKIEKLFVERLGLEKGKINRDMVII
jgi:acyl carrier protein